MCSSDLPSGRGAWTAAALLGAVLFAGLGGAMAADLKLVRIGTNLVTGLYYPTGGALCRMLIKTRDIFGLRCLVESTNGSTANIRGLRDGDLEFGIVQSDWQFHAVRGNGVFRAGGPGGGPVKDLRAVFSLHAEALTIAVKDDSAIRSFDQLRGKRVNAGADGSGPRILFDALVAASGWRAADFAGLTDLAGAEQIKALCEGAIDAAVLMTAHPAMAAQELRARCAVRFIAVSGEAVDRLIKDRPYYAKTIIPAALYPGMGEDVPTLGVRATLVALSTTSADTVYALVKSVFDRFEDFTALHPGLAGLRKEEMISSAITAPLHEGALRYFREAGLVK